MHAQRSLFASLALLLALLLPACVVIDVRADSGGHGVASHGFIGGYATAGWPADNSILKIGLFDGRSRGTILMIQVWKLVRLEIGFIGISAGIGPLDAGIGVLLYDPVPPAYVHDEELPAPAPAPPPAPPPTPLHA